MKNFIREEWEVSGTIEKDLVEYLAFIDEKTHIEVINPLDITLVSVAKVSDNAFYVMKISPFDMTVDNLFPIKSENTYFSKNRGNTGVYTFERLNKLGIDGAFREEIKAAGFWMVYEFEDERKVALIPSAAFISTLSRQLGCTKLPSINDPIREIFIGHLLRHADDFSVVYRLGSRFGKVFAAMSPSFKTLPQLSVFRDCYNTLKEYCPCTVKKYTLNHFLTKITFLLQKYQRRYFLGDNRIKKISASVMLQYSDVGDSAYNLETCISINGVDTYLECGIVRNHKGDVNITELTHVFAQNMLHKLDNVFALIDSVPTDTLYDRHELYTKFFNKIDLKGFIGCKNAPILLSYINKSEEQKITARDFLFNILDLPGNANKIHLEATGSPAPEYFITGLRKAVGKIFTEGVSILWK